MEIKWVVLMEVRWVVLMEVCDFHVSQLEANIILPLGMGPRGPGGVQGAVQGGLQGAMTGAMMGMFG